MAITKCLIWVQTVNRFTVAPRAVSQCGCTGDRMGPFAGLMEKIMSKTNDSCSHRDRTSLSTFELAAVTAGDLNTSGGKQGGPKVPAYMNVKLKEVLVTTV